MRKVPTTWQYLLDIITKVRLDTAAKSKDPAWRAKQERYYKGLSEDECTFSRPTRPADASGKWEVDITCKGRGWKLEKVRYNTGTIFGMTRAASNYMVREEGLETQNVTGLYWLVGSERLHLLAHPQSNIWEALQLTGYEFSPAQFTTEIYPSRNVELRADGHIDIKDSVVAGRIYLSYVQHQPQPSTVAPVESPLESILKREPEAVKVEDLKNINTDVIFKLDRAPVEPVKEEVKPDAEEAEVQALIDAEDKPEEKNNHNQKKKNK